MVRLKKIVLFIVEGITDEMSLSLILSKLIDDSSVQFHVINQDITADFNSNSQNIIKKIDGEVKKFNTEDMDNIYISKFVTYLAFCSINSLLGSTFSPIKIVNI